MDFIKTSNYLKYWNFCDLFQKELGWQKPLQTEQPLVYQEHDNEFEIHPVAWKGEAAVYFCYLEFNFTIAYYRNKIYKYVQSVKQKPFFIIFCYTDSKCHQVQKWQYISKEAGNKTLTVRRKNFIKVINKLSFLNFSTYPLNDVDDTRISSQIHRFFVF
jgi:hypothetical protein